MIKLLEDYHIDKDLLSKLNKLISTYPGPDGLPRISGVKNPSKNGRLWKPIIQKFMVDNNCRISVRKLSPYDKVFTITYIGK